MSYARSLGRLAFRSWIKSSEIRPALVEGDLPSLTYSGVLPLPRGWISGVQTSVSAVDDINIAVGQVRDSSDTVNILHTLAGGITKQSDATWTAGHNAGGLNATDFASGSSGLEPDTTYHLYLIKHTDGTVDAGFDKSTTAANLLSDSGYTYYRRVASVVTDSTAAPNANILGYTQTGKHFVLDDPPTGQTTSAQADDTAFTVTLPGCPVGFSYLAEISGIVLEGSVHDVYISSLTQDDEAASRTTAPYATIVGSGAANTGSGITQKMVQTNTSAQFRVRHKSATASAMDTFIATCTGWFDDLGRYD